MVQGGEGETREDMNDGKVFHREFGGKKLGKDFKRQIMKIGNN